MYGCTSPREPIVSNVIRNDSCGLNVKNVDDVDVNMTAGTVSEPEPSGQGGQPEDGLDPIDLGAEATA